MPLAKMIEYRNASPEVRAVLASDPPMLARLWRSVQQVMAPGGYRVPVVPEFPPE